MTMFFQQRRDYNTSVTSTPDDLPLPLAPPRPVTASASSPAPLLDASGSGLTGPTRGPRLPIEQVQLVLTAGLRLDWTEVFGNEHPVELEIGSGKGTFLLRRALDRPDLNFLGIEWANEFYRFAADRMARWGLTNVRMLRADAGVFMRTVCPRDSLAALHLYHPDPWPKRRHQRRRLVQPDFVDAVAACLIHGGRWAIQTDHAEYFAWITERVQAHPSLAPTPFHEADSGVAGAGVGTNFEAKYRLEGRAIYQLALRKCAAGPPADGA